MDQIRKPSSAGNDAKPSARTRTGPANLILGLSRTRIKVAASQSSGTHRAWIRATAVDDKETETGSAGKKDAIVAPARVVASKAAIHSVLSVGK